MGVKMKNIKEYKDNQAKTLAVVCCLCQMSEDDLDQIISNKKPGKRTFLINFIMGIASQINTLDPSNKMSVEELLPVFNNEAIVAILRNMVTGQPLPIEWFLEGCVGGAPIP